MRSPKKATLIRKATKAKLSKLVTVAQIRKRYKFPRLKKSELTKRLTKSQLAKLIPKAKLLPKQPKPKPKTPPKPRYGVKRKLTKTFAQSKHIIYDYDTYPNKRDTVYIATLHPPESFCFLRASVSLAKGTGGKGSTGYRSGFVTRLDEASDFLSDSINKIMLSNSATESGLFEGVTKWSLVVIIPREGTNNAEGTQAV
jgi:hypothetical protein